MSHDDDFRVEPVRGLPERPPEGERILWQGAPHPWALARSALKVHWVAGYFLFFAVWRGSAFALDGRAGEGLVIAVWFLGIGAVACGVLTAMAWVMARATVYTLTNRRVAMRIGAALTMTLNLPHQWIASANLKRDRHGIGTIALEIKGDTRLSTFALWPHARPWYLEKPQPALRCIPDAERVAAILGEAASTRIAEVEGTAALGPAAETATPPAAIAAE